MTHRLLNLAKRDWASFDGQAASQGFDPLELPADRMLNLIYWWFTHDAADQADVDRFDRQLWRPPAGTAPAPGSPWSPEAETEAFQSLAAAFGVGDTSKAREGAQTPPA